MGNKELHRKVLASFLVLTVLIGTTGFIFEEHKCSHCGTDYSVMFLNDGASHKDLCSDIPAKTCCSGDDANVPQNISEESCTLEGLSCCSYKSESISISDPIQISSTEIIITPGEHCGYFYNFNYNAQNPEHINFRSFYIHPPGRQTLALNSQFLN